jgi:hypothetical protein
VWKRLEDGRVGIMFGVFVVMTREVFGFHFCLLVWIVWTDIYHCV